MARTEDRQAFPRVPGGGADLVVGANDPDDVVRIWVEGEQYPRIVLDPHESEVRIGDGSSAPEAIGGSDTYVAASASGSITVDYATARVHRLTLTGNVTAASFIGATSGVACSLTLYLVQDATGNRTFAWPAAVKFPGGTDPVLSANANAIDIVVLETTDGGTTWFANLAGLAYS